MWTDWTYWLALGRYYAKLFLNLNSILCILQQTIEFLVIVHTYVQHCLIKDNKLA